MMILLNLVFIMLIVLAVAVVQASKIRRAVVLSAVFSMLASFAYLLLASPDVALAEAIIGSTLSTIIFLVAIKKYQVFSIYYMQKKDRLNDREISRNRGSLLSLLETCLLEHEVEPQIIYTVESAETIKEKHVLDILVEDSPHLTTLYGERSSYLFNEIVARVKKKEPDRALAIVELYEEEPS